MKTTTQKNKHVRFWMFNISMLTTIALNAETTNTFTKVMKESFSGDGFISVYIIGGVLVFGIISYLIVSKIEKAEKTDEKERDNVRPISQRHHHSHRIIKKSA